MQLAVFSTACTPAKVSLVGYRARHMVLVKMIKALAVMAPTWPTLMTCHGAMA